MRDSSIIEEELIEIAAMADEGTKIEQIIAAGKTPLVSWHVHIYNARIGITTSVTRNTKGLHLLRQSARLA